MSNQFWDRLEDFEIIWKDPDSFETVQKVLWLSGNIRTVLKQSGRFWSLLEISGQFWKRPKCFETILKNPNSFENNSGTHTFHSERVFDPPTTSRQKSVWTAPFPAGPFPFSPLLPRSTFSRVGLLENYFAILICDGACFQACHRLQCLSLCLIISVMEH